MLQFYRTLSRVAFASMRGMPDAVEGARLPRADEVLYLTSCTTRSPTWGSW